MCKFTFNHYRNIIENALKQKYIIKSCIEYIEQKNNKTNNTEKLLILRHDVDALPTRALRMAVIEHDLGVHSTYFFRVFSNEYNVLDYNTLNIILKINEYGHEIGYHAEPVDVYKATGIEPQTAYFIGKEVLELILQQKIYGAASHREATGYNNLHEFFEHYSPKQDLDLKYEAYDSENLNLFSTALYLTDGYEWYWRTFKQGKITPNKECACQVLERGNESLIYLLTHPNLWFEKHYHVW